MGVIPGKSSGARSSGLSTEENGDDGGGDRGGDKNARTGEKVEDKVVEADAEEAVVVEDGRETRAEAVGVEICDVEEGTVSSFGRSAWSGFGVASDTACESLGALGNATNVALLADMNGGRNKSARERFSAPSMSVSPLALVDSRARSAFGSTRKAGWRPSG